MTQYRLKLTLLMTVVSLACLFTGNAEEALMSRLDKLQQTIRQGDLTIVPGKAPKIANGVMLTISGKGQGVIYKAVKFDATAQDKFMLEMQGAPENEGLAVKLFIVTLSPAGKRNTYYSRALPVTTPVRKKTVMGLDTDFQMGDAKHRIIELGMAVDSSKLAADKASMVFTECQIVDAGKLGAGKGMEKTLVASQTSGAKLPFKVPVLQVFMDLANGDFRAKNSSRGKVIIETGMGGNKTFSDILAQPLANSIQAENSLKPDTDVIVFARNKFDFKAKFLGVTLNKRNLKPGDTLEVTYYWRNLSPRKIAPQDIKLHKPSGRRVARCAVHFMNPASKRPYQIELNGDHNLRPAISEWEPGQLVKDGPYKFKITENTATGVYSIRIGGWFIANKKRHYLTMKDMFQVNGQQALPANSKLLEAPASLPAVVPLNDHVKEIKKAVEGGKGLLLFGKMIPSYDVLAPVKIISDAPSTSVPRMNIHVVKPDHPLFKGAEINSITFAKYLDIKPLPGTTVLAEWDDGTPAVVEKTVGKGRVLYLGFGLGQDIIKSDVFYDELYLRALYYLAGKQDVIKRLPAIAYLVSAGKKLAEFKTVSYVLNKGGEKLAALYQDYIAALGLFNNNQSLSPAMMQQGRKALAEFEKQYLTKDGKTYYAGASENNFSRLGWGMDDGWLVHTRNKSMDCLVKNQMSYSVTFEMQEFLELNGLWKFITDPNDKGITEGYTKPEFDDKKWRDMEVPAWWEDFIGEYDGIVWYRLRVQIPKEWEGKKLLFRCKGIDDLDTTFFNGTQIGRTGKETSEYWIHERTYVIPPEIIAYGKDNVIAVRVNDLRGSGGFVNYPRIEVVNESKQAEHQEIAVQSINWVSKVSEVTLGQKKMTVTDSMLFPGSLYQTAENKCVINFKGLSHIAYLGAESEITVSDLGKEALPADLGKKMKENWLLLWREGEPDKLPILLLLSNCPDTIQVQTVNQEPQALLLNNQQGIGQFVVAYPLGIKAIENVKAWAARIPGEVLATCRYLAQMAQQFPVNCSEAYTVNEKDDTVTIADRFHYKSITNSWTKNPVKAVFLPPMVGFIRDKVPELLPQTSAGIVNFNIPTKYGLLKGRLDHSFIDYTVALPAFQNQVYVDVAGEQNLKGMLNNHFKQGRKWSCGGGVPESALNHQLPFYNIHQFSLGLMESMLGKEFLDDDNQQKLFNRISYRLQKSFELYQHKSVVRYREEPFSKIRYAIIFDSFYKNRTNYNGKEGSGLIYGDANEASTLIPTLAYLYGMHYGQWDFLRANWKFLKEAMKLIFVSDDWAYMGTGCREYGAGIWIDMLNCEYPGTIVFAKLSKALGDTAEYKHALYRAARREIPTLARLWIGDYVNHYYGEAVTSCIATGFSESYGVKPVYADVSKNLLIGGHDLFETSQGTYKEIDQIYEQFGRNKLDWYFKQVFLPALKNQELPVAFPVIRNLAVWKQMPFAELEKKAGEYEKEWDYWKKDWVGMKQCDQIGSLIHSKNPQVYLCDWQPAKLLDSLYDPAVKTLTVKLEKAKNGKVPWTVALFAASKPEVITINNKTLAEASWQQDPKNGIVIIPVAEQGNVEITVKLK